MQTNSISYAHSPLDISLTPLQDQSWVRYLRDQVLPIYLTDTVKARYMQPDAIYRRAVPEDSTPSVHSQLCLVAKT